MLSNVFIRSAAAFGGTPFRLAKSTALGSAGSGAAGGAAVGGVPGAIVGGALGTPPTAAPPAAPEPAEFEQTFGSLTDDELISSCPSRYTQTASEKMTYLKELAAKDKEVRDKAAAAAKEKEEKDKVEKENADFQSRLMEIFK